MNTPVKELLLTRHLFKAGQRALSEQGHFSDGMAVSLFQDSAELMARTVAKSLGAGADKTFDSIWAAVDKIEGPSGRRLPHKSEMETLNKSRVLFKHFGEPPTRSYAVRAATDIELFLSSACQTFFGKDFDSLSMVDVVTHDLTRARLKKALESTEAGRTEEALIECAKARYYIEQPLKFLIPPIDPGRHGSKGSFEVRELAKDFNRLRDFVTGASLGIKLIDLLRLRALLPGLSVSPMTGDYQVQIAPGLKRTPEDAKFCVELLTEYALSVQKVTDPLNEEGLKYVYKVPLKEPDEESPASPSPSQNPAPTSQPAPPQPPPTAPTPPAAGSEPRTHPPTP